MRKLIIIGMVTLVILALITTFAFAQIQRSPSQVPQQSPPKVVLPSPQPPLPLQVVPPYITWFQINNGAAASNNATVTLNFAVGQKPELAKKRVTSTAPTGVDFKPTHYRWMLKSCRETNTMPNVWSQWLQLPPTGYNQPRVTLSGTRKKAGVHNLNKGVCGRAEFALQVKNSAGESNTMYDQIVFITQSEFYFDSEGLFRVYSGKVVNKSVGSACKAADVEGAEPLAGTDQLYISAWRSGEEWNFTKHFFATGVTPANGSSCEYDLYLNAILPDGWSVVRFNLDLSCDGIPGFAMEMKPGAYGCTAIKVPIPGGRDLETRVRVWTDALKTPGTWGIVSPGVVIKGNCNGAGFPHSDFLR